MEYRDLEILATDPQVIKADDKKRVTFKLQVPGVINEPVNAEYDAVAMRNLREPVELGDASWEAAIALGAFLSNALLPTAVRDVIRTRLVQAEAEGGGVRLRLMLSGNELSGIPWEFLLLNDGGGEAKPSDFLALRHSVSIVRHPGTPLPPWKVAAGKPAKMAVALASPVDDSLAKLDMAKERSVIEQAVENFVNNGRVQVTYANRAKVNDLPDAQHPAHLFHFAGHGQFDKTQAPQFGKWEGNGSIVLEDAAGDPDYLPAGTVAVKLQEAGVRVAVLGACVSAKNDDVNMWASVALSLMKANLGAVVAMQYNVRDTSAIAFADKFYSALLSGLTIDEAVSAGRIAVMAAKDVRGFATPVLFLRAPDGVVFPEYKDDPQLAAEREQLRLEADVDIDEVSGEATVIDIDDMQSGTASAKAQVKTVTKDGHFIGIKVGKMGGGSIRSDQNADSVEGDMTGVDLGNL